MSSFRVPQSIPKTMCWHIDCDTVCGTHFERVVITNHRVQRDMPETGGYCWRTPKCRNLCIPHAFLEGKTAEKTPLRKSTSRTLKDVGQQYPGVNGTSAD